jgi:NADH:ubiquinone oxidoreductase subunit F (NADH-binding)/(2Fe-2S) ferredoxin/NAD-dependent dihydropyrimidine dehydrogenase PreA subunit
MAKLTPKTLTELNSRYKKELKKYKALVMCCTGTGCVSSNGFAVSDAFKKALKKHKVANDYLVVNTGCNGFCAVGPIAVIQPAGIFYQKLTAEDCDRIVKEHFIGGKIVEELVYRDPMTDKLIPKMDEIPFFAKQELVALRNKGLVDPENIESYIARDGYNALKKVLKLKPEAIISQVIKSGLRGRGGGGFPTGVKWESCLDAVKKNKEEAYILCNADEGDPGAFMDRSILEADPHSVIEGMTIAAFALNSKEGYVYVRHEYPLAMKRLEKAIKDARTKGLLGTKILGTNFSFDIKIHRGAGAFVCGESSALMQSMEGKVGEPRQKYVRSVEKGFRDKPTVLNNVETWANIPVIIQKGWDWFAKIGTGDVSENPWGGSSGTKVFSLVGNIANTGLVEVPMGTTLREIIYDIGGGIPNGKKFKAVQTGGPSGGCIPAEHLDTPVDFDSLTKLGSMMGSGGMIVMDEDTCMVDVARYFTEFLKDESCGKCNPCREGTTIAADILNKICNGKGKKEHIDQLMDICQMMTASSLCELGKTAANPILSTLKYFKEEYIEHIEKKKCKAGVCKPLIKFEITKECTGCTVCARKCPQKCISGEKKKLHKINQSACIKCGICKDVCKFNAVTVK